MGLMAGSRQTGAGDLRAVLGILAAEAARVLMRGARREEAAELGLEAGLLLVDALQRPVQPHVAVDRRVEHERPGAAGEQRRVGGADEAP